MAFSIQFTEGPGHATALAREAGQSGWDQVWSVGGDGTLNEIVNGVAPLPKSKRPAIGILSRGTGGDFYRRLKEVYKNLKGFKWMNVTKEIEVDIGELKITDPQGQTKKRFFINNADAGISGEVVRRVNAGPKKLRRLEYVISTVAAAWNYQAPKVRFSGFEQEGFPETMPLLLFVVANGRYFGSGMCIAPEAEWDDGHFQILASQKISFLSLLSRLPQLYRKRRLNHENIYYGSVARGTLESLEGPMPLDVDGEFLLAQEMTFTNQPKALKILVPQS